MCEAQKILCYLLLVVGLMACRPDSVDESVNDVLDAGFQRDLADIKKDGKLRALIINSPTEYFIYRGKPMGFEYDMLTRLADDLGLELVLQVEKNLDSVFHHLEMGKADIVAHGLTITKDRKEWVAFTDYLYLTKQVLVQRKPDGWRTMYWAELERSLIHDPIELIGDTVTVRANSSYMQRLSNLSDEIGGELYIDTLSGELSTEEAIKMVHEGKIKYTVSDRNIAKIMASYYPDLDVSVPMSFSQRIAWAVRHGSPELLEAVNDWIRKEREGVDYYVIYNKYYKNTHQFRKRVKSDFFSLGKNKVSEYDEIVKEYADSLGWDWRLLSSQVYQESQFDPEVESWAGARGLMQLLPTTAAEMGIEDMSDPRESIKGGTRYLKLLHGYFVEIPDSMQRIKFTMAAYNCGYGHVKDAQRLAVKEGKDQLIWDENVEDMLLALSYPKYYQLPGIAYGYVRGIEPHTYVRQIFGRYDHYLNFIEDGDED